MSPVWDKIHMSFLYAIARKRLFKQRARLRPRMYVTCNFVTSHQFVTKLNFVKSVLYVLPYVRHQADSWWRCVPKLKWSRERSYFIGLGISIWSYSESVIVVRLMASKFVESYHNHMTIILYGPYDKDHIVWTILYGTYKMGYVKVKNCNIDFKNKTYFENVLFVVKKIPLIDFQ